MIAAVSKEVRHATSKFSISFLGKHQQAAAPTCINSLYSSRIGESSKCHHRSNLFRTKYPFSTSTQESQPNYNATQAMEKGSSNTDIDSNVSDSDSEEKKSNEAPKRKFSMVPIADVLKAKHTVRWVQPTICQDATVREAISFSIDRGLSGLMVVDREVMLSDTSRERGRVVGMTTSRDLLRVMAKGLKENQAPEEMLDCRIKEFMTPLSQVIYARPEETIGMCRGIMAKLGVKCLPILSEGRVDGLITFRDLNDYGLDAKDRGGKSNFLKDVRDRVGLAINTSMAEPPQYLQANMALEQKPLHTSVGIAELPHPFKTDAGVTMRRRDHGPHDLCTDPELSEDAHFVINVRNPDDSLTKLQDVLYLGVADGVGSWREYGVDPRLFSQRLIDECRNILSEFSASNAAGLKAKNSEGKYRRAWSPAELLDEAYTRVKAANVIGSSTACVAFFDSARHQLHFSNLGDSGIIVLRHIDSNIAGALKRDRTKPRLERKSDLRVAFVSTQQLQAFNHPYQLGWTGEELKDGDTSFKSPSESCTTSIHIRRGDIIIMATDGLFDNVDIDDIAQTALEWEQRNSFVRFADLLAKESYSINGLSQQAIPELAQELCEKARENSLNEAVDSPFAILAKENDIMWSGGMPDDCTVIALHVTGKILDET